MFLSFVPAGLILVGDGEPTDESVGYCLSPCRAWEIHAVIARPVAQALECTDDVRDSIDDGCLHAQSRQRRVGGPAGTPDNSPAIHRWENVKRIHPSPGGAKENTAPNRHVLPSLTGLVSVPRQRPAFQRWELVGNQHPLALDVCHEACHHQQQYYLKSSFHSIFPSHTSMETAIDSNMSQQRQQRRIFADPQPVIQIGQIDRSGAGDSGGSAHALPLRPGRRHTGGRLGF